MRNTIILLLSTFTFLLYSGNVSCQDFVHVTSDDMVQYFLGDFDNWEKEMNSSGFEIIPETANLARAGGRIYQIGELYSLCQCLSKIDGLVSLHFFNWLNGERNLEYLFGEIQSRGSFLAEQEHGLKYYAYKGYIWGLQYSDNESFLQEDVFLTSPENLK